MPIAKYGTPSTNEIPDAVSEYLQYFDAVLLENHGALTYSDSLEAAYMKMESLEFYAKLLYISENLGGPQELSREQVEKLYEIRRQFGMTGKHPANLCPNTLSGKPSCHTCGVSHKSNYETKEGTNSELVAEVTKKVIEKLNIK